MSYAETQNTWEEKLRTVNIRIAALQDFEKKSELERNRRIIACGRALMDLRDAVDAGELGEQATWTEWFEENIRSISLRTARYYMQVAGDKEPEAKVIELRQRSTEQHKAVRDKAKVPDRQYTAAVEPKPKTVDLSKVPTLKAPPKYPSSPDDDRLIAEIMEIFHKLSWNGIVRLYKEIAATYHKWQQEGRRS